MTASELTHTVRECPLAIELAQRLRQSREELVRHWLTRISARVSLTPNRVFPTESLLDHVPILIDGIADYLESPAAEVSTDMPVVGKALELGALRHRQGFDVYEIMKEYEILGGILFNFLSDAADEIPAPCEKSELLVCGHRLFRAVAIIQQTTIAHYLRLADEKVADREDRLRAFNRMMSHEIKNDVGAILGAGDLLATIDSTLEPGKRQQLQEMIVRRARGMRGTIENLVVLSRQENDVRQHRHIRLPEAAKEATRQTRETAQAARIDVRLGEFPDVEVSAGVVELALTNYLTNAIKYASPGSAPSYVEIAASVRTTDDTSEIVVSVTDNGMGVPADKREKLFQRFYRAHDSVTDIEGTGLGLSIVKEMIESIGGKAWAEFPSVGSRFCFSLPFRRAEGADRPEGAATVNQAEQERRE
jgi:signal transduction histidine kinase